jgi:hypothetical protein
MPWLSNKPSPLPCRPKVATMDQTRVVMSWWHVFFMPNILSYEWCHFSKKKKVNGATKMIYNFNKGQKLAEKNNPDQNLT